MGTISHPETNAIPAPLLDRCPAGCDLSRTVLYWFRRCRELVADLEAMGTSPDAEVLSADLAAAERTIDRLIASGRQAS